MDFGDQALTDNAAAWQAHLLRRTWAVEQILRENPGLSRAYVTALYDQVLDARRAPLPAPTPALPRAPAPAVRLRPRHGTGGPADRPPSERWVAAVAIVGILLAGTGLLAAVTGGRMLTARPSPAEAAGATVVADGVMVSRREPDAEAP